MHSYMPYLGLGLAIAVLAAGVALWYFSVSPRTGDTRREQREKKRIASQPWDAESADGRGNR